MLTTLLTTALLLASEPEVLTGQVRVGSGVGAAVVELQTQGGTVALAGDLVPEIQTLASAKVEVQGVRDGGRFLVAGYSIVEVNGQKPALVGELVAYGTKLAVSTGNGEPIPLSTGPKLRQKLDKKLGGKVWVAGTSLLSGEIKVSQFGILREPRPASVAPKENAD